MLRADRKWHTLVTLWHTFIDWVATNLSQDKIYMENAVLCIGIRNISLIQITNCLILMYIRWVSVVEFHDPTLGISKVFGQESTVVKWNYQILGLHQVMVCQKLGVILIIKWFKNWSQQKMLFTKKVRLNWYSSMNFFLERFGWFLT